MRSDKVFYGPGCEHWYAIEPRGFVCVDGKRATLDANDPVLRALEPHAPDLSTAWLIACSQPARVMRAARIRSWFDFVPQPLR